MLLNRIWIGLFVIGFITACVKAFGYADWDIFHRMVTALFDSTVTGFQLSIGLTGILALWMGIMKIGEDGGAVRILSKLVAPLFTRLFPEIPKDHPVFGTIMMNYSANMLGLDNAATPIGLKAMGQLQELNPEKEQASNAQIMFLVLNTSGLTLIPVSIISYRLLSKSADPTEVFLPILLATYCSTMAGLLYVSIRQKISLLNGVVLAYLGGLTLLITSLVYTLFAYPEKIDFISKFVGNFLLFFVIIAFISLAVRAKVNVYESFIDGAKGGFEVAIKIIPYLIAILAAVAVFRASGAMDGLMDGVRFLLKVLGVECMQIADALPTGLLKPFSGGGARGLMVDVFENGPGPDSFAGRLASVFQGSTETTFYVLSVYFGSVQIKKVRYAAAAGLFADVVGIIAAIFITLLFFTC
jgi:spore maturation protein SpmA